MESVLHDSLIIVVFRDVPEYHYQWVLVNFDGIGIDECWLVLVVSVSDIA